MVCRIHKHEKIVEVIFIGLLTEKTVQKDLVELICQFRSNITPGYHLLVDLTRAESNLRFGEMLNLVRFIRPNCVGFEKIGVLCENLLNFGTSRMFQLLYREKSDDIKIDLCRKALISWLKT